MDNVVEHDEMNNRRIGIAVTLVIMGAVLGWYSGAPVIGMIWFGGYLVPWLVAEIRGARQVNAVLVINIFLGWTLIGWVGALALAVMRDKE